MKWLACGLCFLTAAVVSLPGSSQENQDRVGRNRQDPKQRQRGERQRRSRPTEAGAPQVGDMAPTFKLKSLDGKSVTDLGSFKGKKPVVLLFGSYT